MQSWKTAFSAYFQTEKSRPRALHVAARRSQLKRTTNQRRRSASPAPLPPPSSRAVIAAPSPNVFIGSRHPSPNSNTYTEPQTNPSSRSRETAADRNVSNNSKTSSRKDISFPGVSKIGSNLSCARSALLPGGRAGLYRVAWMRHKHGKPDDELSVQRSRDPPMQAPINGFGDHRGVKWGWNYASGSPFVEKSWSEQSNNKRSRGYKHICSE
ncbi:hypothetical protein Bbelb_340470 [Branchiostoma belcheri]|nr:hypothetical protein Bbelb_340470 [Branchiostoma belcheri]